MNITDPDSIVLGEANLLINRVNITGNSIFVSDSQSDLTTTGGGSILVRTPNGSITLSSTTSTDGDITTAGGDVNLFSKNQVQVGNITTQGGDVQVRSNPNNTSLNQNNSANIRLGNIETSGGDITIRNTDRSVTDQTGRVVGGIDNDSDITVQSINAGETTGGDITVVTERFLRVTGETSSSSSSPDSKLSVFTSSEGIVAINHGGNGDVLFTVGFELDPAQNGTNNGTRWGISTNQGTIVRSNPALNEYLFTNILPNSGFFTSINTIATFTPGSNNIISVPNPLGVNQLNLGANLDVDSETADDLRDVSRELRTVAETTGVNPAILIVDFVPRITENLITKEVRPESDNSELVLQVKLIVPETGNTKASERVVTRNTITREDVLLMGDELFREVSLRDLVTRRGTDSQRVEIARKLEEKTYQDSAQKLYDWLIRPFDDILSENDIENIAFILPEGMRMIPLAALYDSQEKEHLIEKEFSIGLMPRLSLVDTTYRPLADLGSSQVLALGASEFPLTNDPNIPIESALPAVPLELDQIEAEWNADTLRNEEFTIENLMNAKNKQTYDIVHLATHGAFVGTNAESNYIRFYNEILTLNPEALRPLELDKPGLELLVISACETAFGNLETELGFAGLALLTGAKTSLATLWKVGDTGTLGMMTQFYQQLSRLSKLPIPTDSEQESPNLIKAEVLRLSQIAMINGNIKQDGNVLRVQLIDESGNIRETEIPLPPAIRNETNDFTHPFFWAGFTMVGSPW